MMMTTIIKTFFKGRLFSLEIVVTVEINGDGTGTSKALSVQNVVAQPACV